MADPGEKPGGAEPLPLFLDQIEARRAEKMFCFFLLAKLLFSNLDCLGNISLFILVFWFIVASFLTEDILQSSGSGCSHHNMDRHYIFGSRNYCIICRVNFTFFVSSSLSDLTQFRKRSVAAFSWRALGIDTVCIATEILKVPLIHYRGIPYSIHHWSIQHSPHERLAVLFFVK